MGPRGRELWERERTCSCTGPWGAEPDDLLLRMPTATVLLCLCRVRDGGRGQILGGEVDVLPLWSCGWTNGAGEVGNASHGGG